MGKAIFSLKRDLNFAICKENFAKAIDIKSRLRKLEAKRDGFDALYETTRYENMIVLDRPSSASYSKHMLALDEKAL